MANVIEHEGVVESLSDSTITVAINQRSACAGCHAYGQCSAAESKVKQVEVLKANANCDCKVGDKVKVTATMGTGRTAVLFACIIPLVLMAITLVISSRLTDNDAISGTISLGVLLPYMLVLWLTRNKFRNKLTFSIELLNN